MEHINSQSEEGSQLSEAFAELLSSLQRRDHFVILNANPPEIPQAMLSAIEQLDLNVRLDCIGFLSAQQGRRSVPELIPIEVEGFKYFCSSLGEDLFKIRPIREQPYRAASSYNDGSIDLICINGGGSVVDLAQSLSAWWPKLREGGVLIGLPYRSIDLRADELATPLEQVVDDFFANDSVSYSHGAFYLRVAKEQRASVSQPETAACTDLDSILRRDSELSKLEKAVANEPTNPELLIAYADGLVSRGFIQESAEYLATAADCSKDDVELQFSIGDRFFSRELWARAVECYQRSISLGQVSPWCLLNKARALRLSGSVEEAEQCLRQYLSVPVNRFSEIEVELASMLRDKQQTLEAMHLLRNAIHENPENIAALVMLGEMYEQAGLYDAAVESYTCALAIDGSQLQAHQGMMRSYLALQSWSLARRHANQLPPHFELDLNLGHQVAISCLRDGQTLEAAQRFLKLIEIEPTNLLLRVNLLESLLKLGHRNELVAEWKRMIKMLESARMPLPGTESEELKAVSHLCDQFALVRSEQEVSEYQQIQESLHELMHGHICDISQEFQQEENEPPEIESEGYFDVHVGPLHYATLSTSRFYRHSTTQNHPAASIGIRLPEESRYHRRPLVTVCDSVSRRHYPGSPFLLPGIQHDSPSGVLHRNVQVPEPFLPQHQEPVGKGRPQKPSVAIIIPNKNGAHLLSSLFQSLKRYNSYPNLEIIVVDQQSTDGSIEICEQQSSSFSVKTCSLGEDCSYSELNNTGVSHTKSSLLLFCNNDIIFHQDIIGSMVRYFDDPDIGVLGVRLHDFVPDGSAARSPIQHLGVTFSFNGWDAPTTPIELRYRPELKEIAHTAWSPPAVTAALAMVRKSNFADIGGFSKEYFFGHEDIDLCLAMRRKLGKVSVCANELSAVHHQGASRGEREEEFQVKIQEKAGRLIDTHGYFVRRSHLSSMLTDPFQWRAYPFRIGFAVSTTDLNKNHGDLFTAMELAESLQESYGWETAFISSEEEWYNVTNLDALVVMCHDYKPSCIPHSWPHLLKIAWMRNHFTEWLGSEEQYDLYWSASQSVTETLQEQFSKDALCLPLAANYEKFSSGKPRVEFSSDYCFAGNYWGFPREVVQNLKPSELPFSFKVFGVGWEACPTFSEYCSGPVPYHQLPNVYASTKIVIDDSTVSTRDAGSLNSRVYEALSAGALVVSNIKAVSPEFEMLPTYSTTDELKEHLWRYLSNDKERMELVSRLQSVVQEQCTYQHRAKQVLDALQQHLTTRFRFAVKVAAERSRENKKNRECIIAENLAQALRRAGHLARVDFMEDWHCWQSGADDVAIVVGENFGYRLKPHQINFLIYTSELESIHRIGCEAFDCIFVATEKCVERMKGNEIEAVECLDVSYEMQSRLNEKVVDSLLATVRKCHQEKML